MERDCLESDCRSSVGGPAGPGSWLLVFIRFKKGGGHKTDKEGPLTGGCCVVHLVL